MQKIRSSLKSLKFSIPYFIGILLFLVTITALIYLDQSYRVKYIRLNASSKNIQIKGLSAFQNDNLFLLSEKDTRKSILENNPYVKDVTVQKEYPDTLSLDITYNQPKAYLKVSDGYYLLTDNAYILEKGTEKHSSNLPVITYYENVPFATNQAGQQLLQKDIQDSLFFLNKLQSLKFAINSIDIKGFDMLGLYTKDKKFFFSSEKDRDEQIYQLAASIQEFNVTGKKFDSLDLRFDRPVVVF